MTENAADLQACAVLEYRAKDAEEFKSLAMWLEGQRVDFYPQVRAGTDDDGPATALAELEVEDDGRWRDAPATGWTKELVQLLLKYLEEGGSGVQAEGMRQGIANGGFLPRVQIYEIGGYPPERRLNHWSTPFGTTMRTLVERHGLPAEAADAMTTRYDESISSYQRTLGYDVAPEIVRLMRQD
ncbi:hypothetical protein ACUXPL_000123 [Micrococcus sp. 140720015-1]